MWNELQRKFYFRDKICTLCTKHSIFIKIHDNVYKMCKITLHIKHDNIQRTLHTYFLVKIPAVLIYRFM